MKQQNSTELFTRAQRAMPGGVSSPVRAFAAVGGIPPFVARAKGSRLWDEDGNEYIDYVGSWGTAILGHAPDDILAVLQEAAAKGLSFGAPTKMETLLAEEIIAAIPSVERLRFVSSGTEACMAAIRLARGYTGKKLVIKFAGHYHGHSDGLLAKAGSGMATLSLPSSAGVPEEVVGLTIIADFNDGERLAEIFAQQRGNIAAVIVEPIAGNAGFIRALPGFLERVRELCDNEGALFICDEVMTGFRVGYGGWQNRLSFKPDLTTLGKIVGGGLPLAAYGGRSDIMSCIAPEGAVYQAGTLSGNPLATACGLATLRRLQAPGVYEELARKSAELIAGLEKVIHSFDIPCSGDSEGGMFGFFFSAERVKSFAEAQQSAVHLYPRFFHGMLDQGIYLAPSAYEASFMSLAHSNSDLQRTLAAAQVVCAKVLKP
jgi:glutamate-1-semialdehyde 2,1-aminomutase